MKLEGVEGVSLQELHTKFLNKMCDKLEIQNAESFLSSIKTLFDLSAGDYQNKCIRYPDMNKKEFNSIKNKKYSLTDFSPMK